ncbi:MAG: DUF1565 domain-containing protein [Eubacterium sp.]
MKNLKKVICLLLAVVMTGLISSCSSQSTADSKQPEPVNLCQPQQLQREKRRGDIFVSVSGDDRNSGTKQSPVKTVGRALELAKKLDKEQKVIAFSKGEYPVSALTLTKDYNNIVLYAEDEVVFNGGVTLEPADFTDYKNNIKMLDLKKYGVTREQIGQVRAFGQYNTAEKYNESGSLYCELFCNGERMTLSRYPNANEENLRTGKIIDNGDSKEIYTNEGTQQNPKWEDMKNPRGGTFGADKSLTDRIKSWKNSDDIWLFGYFQYDWADSSTPLESFDESSITTKYASVYGFKEDMPYYFFNVFEELDQPGEWYIDRENLTLYFIPTEDFENNTLQLSLETENLITLDGAENVIIDGITLCGSRAGAIKGSGNGITVKSCTVKNVGESAIDIEGEKILVENNTITATGKAGVVLTGGDRAALKSSENKVVNNLIYDWSQVYQTYQAAVALHGVGGLCSHNEIYNSPHEAITYTGNNHTIEYNVIHDVVLKSSDAGAIYAGRSWSAYGNVVRYNCIYNIGSNGFEPSGIYFDDALSGQEAYGNLLVNIPGCAFLLGGGRDLRITNNVVVNAGTPISYDDRAIAGIEDGGWFAHAKTAGEGLWATLDEVDINSQVWRESYPQLSELSDDFNNTADASFAANPAGSTVESNVIINGKKSVGNIEKRVKKYSTVQNNTLYSFRNNPYTDGDYGKDISVDGFEALPVSQMGRTYK